MFHGKTHYKWWCSIVMLVITRGIQRVSFTQKWCPFSRKHSHHPITIYNQRSWKPGRLIPAQSQHEATRLTRPRLIKHLTGIFRLTLVLFDQLQIFLRGSHQAVPSRLEDAEFPGKKVVGSWVIPRFFMTSWWSILVHGIKIPTLRTAGWWVFPCRTGINWVNHQVLAWTTNAAYILTLATNKNTKSQEGHFRGVKSSFNISMAVSLRQLGLLWIMFYPPVI